VRKERFPSTPAIRTLRENGARFLVRPYKYQEKEVAAAAARELGVDEHLVIKTLVMEDEQKRPLIIMMHGDKQVSTKALARAMGAKFVTPCEPKVAQKHTGYMVGGISPFGTRKRLPVYIEESILDLERIFINAGKKGLLVEISPAELVRILNPTTVNVAR